MPHIPIDLRTLLLVFTLIRITQAIAMLHVWNTHRQYPPARDWALGSFLSALGVLLISFRDLIPVWGSVIFANVFIIPGWMIFDLGIIRATGFRVPWRLGIAVSIAALFSIFWHSIIEPDYVKRLITFNMAVLLFDGYTVYACLKCSKKNKAVTLRIISFSLIMIMASCIWRTISGFNMNMSTILTPTLAQTQFFIAAIFFSIIISIMLVLLTTQKLQNEMNDMAQQLIRQREFERDYAKNIAMTDSLTNLANRRHFDEALSTEFHRLKRTGAPLSLIMLDIDHFKKFNDTYGHLAGDDCLRMVAATINSFAGRTPDIAARYGGEEFCLILPETDHHGVITLAEHVRKAVEDLAIPHAASDTAKHVTVSLGVVTVSTVRLSLPEEVVALADEALYCAKQRGRNRIEDATDSTSTGNYFLQELPGFVKLVWRETDECGHAVIDEQHRRLFESANSLLTSVIGKHPKQECTLLIETLLTDTVKHFHDEEAIFRAASYPLADEHSRYHADLIVRATALAEKYKHDELALGELFSFIIYDVVSQHMFIEDKKFFAYI